MQFVLVVLAQLTGAIIETVAHYFRGIERSEIESAIHASHRFTTLVLAMIVLVWWPRLDYLGAAMLVPAVVAHARFDRDRLAHLSRNREPGTGNRDSATDPVAHSFATSCRSARRC